MATFQGRVVIGDLEVDATVNEGLSVAVDVTEFPVERGADISDHVRPKQPRLRLEGFVSNTPVMVRELLPAGYRLRAQSAFDYLLSTVQNGVVVEILTARRTYENMVLSDLSAPREVATGDAFHFTVSARQIRVVENQTVLLVTRQPNGKPLSKRGKQAGQTPQQDVTPSTSIAKRLTNALGLTKAGSGAAN